MLATGISRILFLVTIRLGCLRSQGSSAGVFELFRTLVLAWSCRQAWPTTWSDARQVHLRKDAPDPLRPTSPDHFFRLGIAFWPGLSWHRKWYVQVVPIQAHGGVRQRWVATALSEVLPKLDARGSSSGPGPPTLTWMA